MYVQTERFTLFQLWKYTFYEIQSRQNNDIPGNNNHDPGF